MKNLSVILLICAAVQFGCSHQPPTIAHTHIGHAITAFDGTPDEKGLFVITEERARDVSRLARELAQADPASSYANTTAEGLIDLVSKPSYGFKHALLEAESHIAFAGGSEDATDNVSKAAKAFSEATRDIVRRCDFAMLLANDYLNSTDNEERQKLADQVLEIMTSTVEGSSDNRQGVRQLRVLLDDMVNAESPPYRTVDRWYLFHLVRLPDCDNCWAWRKWANSSNRGY